MEAILVGLLALMALGALPIWPYSRTWGYVPGALLLTIIFVVVVAVFF